jgi:formiminoglutamase
MWKGFATYNLDENVDLSPFLVADAGDVAMHTTDILLSHLRIQETSAYLARRYPHIPTCMIGGDHSTTACAVRGINEAFSNETIGILQLDTHLDVRDPKDLGPANGTPIRQLIDGHIVKGENVINIGLHGYYNAKPLIDYANEHSIQMVTLKQARKQGLVNTIQSALEQLSAKVDRLYVTVDMDVLDISVAPGVPASTPGGMTAIELFDSLLEIGKHSAVKHIDFVCLDPSKDSSVAETVKTGVYAWLQFITGCILQTRSTTA